MKTLLILPLIVAGFVALSACTTVEAPPRVQTSSTTVESTVRQPAAISTTETRAVRTY